MEATTLKKQNVVKVLAYNLGCLEAVFKDLAKRAKKLGVEAPYYEIGKYVPEAVCKLAVPPIYYPDYYEVEVFGEFPKIPGWTFVGTIEHTEFGNILRASLDEEIPEEYRNSKPTCDHCQKTRNRKDTFLVRNDESGELKRIGRACLKDYLGGRAPEEIAFYLGFEKAIRALEDEEFSRSGSFSMNGWDAVNFLAFSIAWVKHVGYYVSKAKAQENPDLCLTSLAVETQLMKATSKDEKPRSEAIMPTPEQKQQAQEMLEWAKNLEPENGYLANLKIIAQLPVVERKHIGILASLVPTYNRAMDLIEVKEKTEKDSKEAAKAMEFVGEVKKRNHFNITVEKVMQFEGAYGVIHFFIMKDSKGNELIWKASSKPYMFIDNLMTDVQEGKAYKIKGTVKDHKTYNSKPQTVLSRVVFEEELESLRQE